MNSAVNSLTVVIFDRGKDSKKICELKSLSPNETYESLFKDDNLLGPSIFIDLSLWDLPDGNDSLSKKVQFDTVLRYRFRRVITLDKPDLCGLYPRFTKLRQRSSKAAMREQVAASDMLWA